MRLVHVIYKGNGKVSKYKQCKNIAQLKFKENE